MVGCLTAVRLLQGFRSKAAIDIQAHIGLMTLFSNLFKGPAGQIASVILNSVICSQGECLTAGAGVVLNRIPGANTGM